MGLVSGNHKVVLSLCLLSAIFLFTLPLSASADFAISASPSSLTITQVGFGISTITTTVSGGFNSSISLSASGAPSGVAISFSPSTIGAPGAGSSLMTISSMRQTQLGTYPITVTGNGGGIKHTTTVTLTVIANGSFSLSANPSSISIAQGKQGTSTITASVSGGFNYPISLSASGMPSGVTVNFNPQIIPAPGSGSSVMTITVGSATPTGTYPITVTGTGGGIQKNVVVTLTVTSQGGKNFAISASPSSLTVAQGKQGTSTITTTISGGFNSAISLSASGMPTGVTISFNPPTIPAPGSGNSTMTISVVKFTRTGTYPITVSGNGGGIQRQTTVTLTVAAPSDFNLSASPGTVTIVQGKQGTSTITSTVSGGFNSSISLSATGMPSGTTVIFNPQPIPAPGSGNSTMTITVATNSPTGTYLLTVTGNGGGVLRNVLVNLTVAPMPNFAISAWPLALSVAQGNQAISTVTTVACCGFNYDINLSIAGVPGGTTASLNPQTISAPGSGTSTLTLNVGNTPTGTYPMTVTGSGGGLQYPVTLTLTVTGGPAPTDAYFMESYSYSLQSSFGTPPYTYQITSGALPTGLSMNSSGNITGTPSVVGQFSFQVLAKDSSQPQQQQSSSYTLKVAIGLDDYSGLTAAPVPGCNPTGYFQTLKVKGRWLLATPECNTFYQFSLYDADDTFILSQIMTDRYGNDETKWALHTLNRMQAFNFNSLDIFSSTKLQPVETYWQAPPPIHIPFELYNAALVDVRQNPAGAGLSEPMKDLCAGQDSNGFTGYCGFTLDIFDANWQAANTYELNDLGNTYTAGFADSPWIIGISLGDSGNLSSLVGNGNGHDGASLYAHVGMLVATTNFQQTTYSGGTYSDPEVYSKYAWVTYLQNKYHTIAALNSAWNTGGYYTAFGDAGGFGTGSGVLDEDGRHTQWFGKDFYNLKGMNSNLQGDVNQFLYNFTIQAYKVQADTFRTVDTNHMFICGVFGGNGVGGARPQVLQGLKDSGCNIQVWTWDADLPSSSLAAFQVMYDIVGTPAMVMYDTTAQLDSDMSNYPSNGSSGGNYTTQEDRGSHYASDQPALLQAQGSNSDYYMVGSSLWGLTDMAPEHSNMGLLSLSDNSYDGVCAVRAASIDQWGYACGGEVADYGDYTGAVTQANSNTLQQLILTVRQ